MNERSAYLTDVSDEEWAFAAPYLILMDEQAPQRKHDLRMIFNALGWMAWAGATWRLPPNDFSSWQAVYQHTRRWLRAGCFEAMVSDLWSIIRLALARRGLPSAVILDGRTLQSSCESGLVRATMATNARREARFIWWWIRWATCWPSTSHRLMNRSARK